MNDLSQDQLENHRQPHDAWTGSLLPYDYAAGALSAKLDTWPYFGWALLYVVGQLVIILAPWTAVYLYRYVVERIRVPGRPNLSFTGQPLDIWYVLPVEVVRFGLNPCRRRLAELGFNTDPRKDGGGLFVDGAFRFSSPADARSRSRSSLRSALSTLRAKNPPY